jgi:hypothetical protein
MNSTRDAIDHSDLARRLATIWIPGSDAVLDRTLALYEAGTNRTRRRRWPKPGLLICRRLGMPCCGIGSDRSFDRR